MTNKLKKNIGNVLLGLLFPIFFFGTGNCQCSRPFIHHSCEVDSDCHTSEYCVQGVCTLQEVLDGNIEHVESIQDKKADFFESRIEEKYLEQALEISEESSHEIPKDRPHDSIADITTPDAKPDSSQDRNQEKALSWAIKTGGVGTYLGEKIVTDSAGNSYITGLFDEVIGNQNFGRFHLVSNGREDLFVAKISPKGVFVWARSFGGLGWDGGTGLGLDLLGNIYITGFFSEEINIGGRKLKSRPWYPDIFIAKLTPQGAPLWAVSSTGKALGSHRSTDLATDPMGNTYVTGYFSNKMTLGPVTLSSNKRIGHFVARLDPKGNVLWATSTEGGGITTLFGSSIALEKHGEIYVTGIFEKQARFGATSLRSQGEQDIFVARLDSKGNILWATSFGGKGYDQSKGVAVDQQGNVYVVGEFRGRVRFGSQWLPAIKPAPSYTDTFVAKLTPNGKVVWVLSSGGDGPNGAEHLAVSRINFLYVLGLFNVKVSFGSTTLVSRYRKTDTYIWSLSRP